MGERKAAIPSESLRNGHGGGEGKVEPNRFPKFSSPAILSVLRRTSRDPTPFQQIKDFKEDGPDFGNKEGTEAVSMDLRSPGKGLAPNVV